MPGFDTGPGFVDETGDGITLDREGRHPPGVDDIGSGYQEAHLGANRQHQRLVDFEQVVLVLGCLVVDLLGGVARLLKNSTSWPRYL